VHGVILLRASRFAPRRRVESASIHCTERIDREEQAMKQLQRNGARRRRFLKAVPAAVAGGLAVPALARQEQTRRINKDTLECGEKIFGVDFNDAEEEAALTGVNRNLESYEQLRQITVPLDTEPAITFRPYLPGKKPKGTATPHAKMKVTLGGPKSRPSSLDELAFLPVTALASLIQRRDVSSTELTRMYIDRLKKYGPKLNCVVTLTEELALAQAAQADKEIRAGRYKGPLHGIPWGAKDLFATKGILTTWGAGPYQTQVFEYDATIVERLRDAGAVLVAKLSMGALAQGDRWFRGQTKNPWLPDDPARGGSSGSSAGPGSATAAGLVGFAIGTETRGSIISPSAVNGVTGMRPTYGRISRHGAMALSWTMDKIGPMCRSIEDCALVFNAIYGPDGRDDTVVDAPFAWNPDLPLAKLKIGYLKSEFEPPQNDGRGGREGGGRGDAGGRGDGRGRGGVSPEEARRRAEERLKLLNDALEVYRKAGATLTPIALPDNAVKYGNAIAFVLSTEAAAAFDDLTRGAGIKDESLNTWPNTFRTHRFVPAVEFIRAQRIRTLLMREMDTLMSGYDAFLSSTNSPSLGITNLTGHPAVALRAGFVADAPLELMVTGRLYDEATTLRVALAYERATKWNERKPVLT
jgi:Asp-tRNA(Asn)/Glu-tRNA(Gln) amidotransferase A subunit family amidase